MCDTQISIMQFFNSFNKGSIPSNDSKQIFDVTYILKNEIFLLQVEKKNILKH